MKSGVNRLTLRNKLATYAARGERTKELETTMKTIVAVAMMAVSAVASAQINKCLDAKGKVVGYGSECPAGTRSEASGVKASPAPAASSAGSAPAGAPQSAAERDADFRKRQIEKQEADAKSTKKAAAAEQNKRACEDSRAYLASLQGGHRITRTDPKTGERVFLSDPEYAQEIARTQKNMQTNCR